jgi:hypothetical protein
MNLNNRKILFTSLLLFSIVFLLLTSATTSCTVSLPADNIPNAPDTQLVSKYEKYLLPEESTFFTFPEWYIIYSASELSNYLNHNSPVTFPYFQSIGQYWCSYNSISNATKKTYTNNSGHHLKLTVIGISYTAEYTLKGLYEGTVGKYYELLSFFTNVEEDNYARDVARDYAEFLPVTPWYQFPFSEKLIGLWTETNIIGMYPYRKLERKLIYSAEYATKALYATIIKNATQSIYTPEESSILLKTSSIPEEILHADERIKVIQQLDNSLLIEIPRYKVFSEIVSELAEQNVTFIEIAGNNDILITAIAPSETSYTFPPSQVLFTHTILTEPSKKRLAIRTPVSSLTDLIISLESEGYQLEHIYDY